MCPRKSVLQNAKKKLSLSGNLYMDKYGFPPFHLKWNFNRVQVDDTTKVEILNWTPNTLEGLQTNRADTVCAN